MSEANRRLVLRQAAFVPADQVPNRYRASTLAWWYYCAEQARLFTLGIHRPPSVEMKAGTNVDTMIRETFGKRWPWETEFIEKVNEYILGKKGFMRILDDPKNDIYAEITAHPDDFQVTHSKHVSIIEFKLTGMTGKSQRFWEIFKLPPSTFQTQIYAWVLEPIIEDLGYTLNKTHTVSAWGAKYRQKNKVRYLAEWGHSKDYIIHYYPQKVEDNLAFIIDAFKHPEKVIPPRSAPTGFKCRSCWKGHKMKCQFQKKNGGKQKCSLK